MKLTPTQIKQVQDALLNGYDGYNLRMMVRMELGEDLAAIAGDDSLPMRVRVFNLLEWAERSDRVYELIDAAKEQQGSNASIHQLWQDSLLWRQTANTKSIIKPPIEFDWVQIRGGYTHIDTEIDDGSFYWRIVPAFKIARTPVTNAQYEIFVDAVGHPTPPYWEHGRIWPGKENHPVVEVTWHDALAFCKWANVRLPTEAEWEKAARGTSGRSYPWGEDLPSDELCNYGCLRSDTTPVDAYPQGASPYGVLDMAGNVWEWTSSLGKPRPYDADDGREDPTNDGQRVCHGGSWRDDDDLLRCVCRNCADPDLTEDNLGFRVAAIERL